MDTVASSAFPCGHQTRILRLPCVITAGCGAVVRAAGEVIRWVGPGGADRPAARAGKESNCRLAGICRRFVGDWSMLASWQI